MALKLSASQIKGYYAMKQRSEINQLVYDVIATALRKHLEYEAFEGVEENEMNIMIAGKWVNIKFDVDE